MYKELQPLLDVIEKNEKSYIHFTVEGYEEAVKFSDDVEKIDYVVKKNK